MLLVLARSIPSYRRLHRHPSFTSIPAARRRFVSCLLLLLLGGIVVHPPVLLAFSFQHPKFHPLQSRTASRSSPLLFATPTSTNNNMPPTLIFGDTNVDDSSSSSIGTRVALAKADTLLSSSPEATILQGLLSPPLQQALLEPLQSVTKKAVTTSTYIVEREDVYQLVVIGLPNTTSRNNHEYSIHALPDLIQPYIKNPKTNVHLEIYTQPWALGAFAAAIARALPLYSSKTNGNHKHTHKKGKTKQEDDDSNSEKPQRIYVSFYDEMTKEPITDATSTATCTAVAKAVQQAGRLVDMPPQELTTTAFALECQAFAQLYTECVTFQEIVGDALDQQGYGGLYGVGKAAVEAPRLVILEYKPSNDKKNKKAVALVGKGIVYDTGGLSLKSKTGMPGMKGDMGGAAGLLGAFCAAVELQIDTPLVLVLCLAENAIGATAVRNDDILTMYSGKTVEVNNADAEGRLILADGVAHVTQQYGNAVSTMVDMATLTGAQMVTTGKVHAGILTNNVQLEARAIQAGLTSGDLTFPMLYCPELLMDEFTSAVADMKNSVKDRGNAQSSCAGHFIEQHLADDWTGSWMHVDMAGPANGGKDSRGTGYGVGLILALLGVPGFGGGESA